jgi:hypothetical protein
MNGLIINVYTDGHGTDTTNGGISERFDLLTLIGPGISGPFAPTYERPAVTIRRRIIGGDEYLSLVPCDAQAQPLPGWYMFGGNYAKCSDSRFPFSYPLPIHDRLEGTDLDRARIAAREVPEGYELEPVKTGAQLFVGYFGRMAGDSKEMGTGEWKQRFDISSAGHKIAAMLKENPELYIKSVEIVDRYELRPVEVSNV